MIKKIVVIMPTLNAGGAERVISNLIKYINEDEFEINLILVKKEGKFLKDIPKSVNIIDLNKSRYLKSIPQLIKLLNNIKPDILFSSAFHINCSLPMMRFMLNSNPKLVIREPSTPSMYLNKLPFFKNKILKLFVRTQYRKTDLIIAQCEEMKEDIIKELSIPGDKIISIYNPVDTDFIRSQMKKKKPYNDKEINYVAIGRLSYEKGFDILLESFKIVNNEKKNSKLTIVGEGTYRKKLESKIEELDLEKSVELVGYQDNPYPYLYYADIFVLSSRWEGFPNALLEALSTSSKVISFNCKSGPSEILEYGKYGKLVKCEDKSLLAKAMLDYLEQESLTGDRYTKFEITSITDKYEKTFNDLLGEKGYE